MSLQGDHLREAAWPWGLEARDILPRTYPYACGREFPPDTCMLKVSSEAYLQACPASFEFPSRSPASSPSSPLTPADPRHCTDPLQYGGGGHRAELLRQGGRGNWNGRRNGYRNSNNNSNRKVTAMAVASAAKKARVPTHAARCPPHAWGFWDWHGTASDGDGGRTEKDRQTLRWHGVGMGRGVMWVGGTRKVWMAISRHAMVVWAPTMCLPVRVSLRLPPSLLPSFPPSLLPSFPPSLLPSFPLSPSPFLPFSLSLPLSLPASCACLSLCLIFLYLWIGNDGSRRAADTLSPASSPTPAPLIVATTATINCSPGLLPASRNQRLGSVVTSSLALQNIPEVSRMVTPTLAPAFQPPTYTNTCLATSWFADITSTKDAVHGVRSGGCIRLM